MQNLESTNNQLMFSSVMVAVSGGHPNLSSSRLSRHSDESQMIISNIKSPLYMHGQSKVK